MVSKDFSKESPSTVLRQCLISNMDSSPVQTEDLAYGLQCQPNIVPFYYNPRGEEITSSLINREPWEGNSHIGINHGNGYGLSLTLGSLRPSEFQNDRHVNAVNTNYTSSGNLICDGEIHSRACNTSNLSSQTLHGMASILTFLQNSPYMKPAQQLLDEVVCVSNVVELGPDKQVRRSFEITRAAESINLHEENQNSSDEKHAVRIRISKLVALLDQLENRYEQYFHQMDTIVSSFEAIAGVGAATSYTALTIQAMSKHFSNLRDAIIAQLSALGDSLSKDKPKTQKRETLHQLGMIQIRRVWRPLRGLPEESVSLLRSWLFEHFLHPYPTDNEKLMLASQTGLTRNQISNWFINARVRLWKPMIEEMYREEFAEDLHD